MRGIAESQTHKYGACSTELLVMSKGSLQNDSSAAVHGVLISN